MNNIKLSITFFYVNIEFQYCACYKFIEFNIFYEVEQLSCRCIYNYITRLYFRVLTMEEGKFTRAK